MKEHFKKTFLNPFRLKLYFLKHMPMGFFNGLRIIELSDEKASVSVPFNNLTKNPFRSMYFAVQSMAAELSSGILALSVVDEAPVPVSMLVLKMNAEFVKKARTKIVFTCNEGYKIKQAVRESIETGEGQTVTVKAEGVDAESNIVSNFYFTWTFKPKKTK